MAQSKRLISTRFNKISIHGKCPDCKWTRKPLVYRESNIFNLCVIRPPEICVNLVFKHIHAAVTQSVDNLFRSFIVLNENEYFLISNLHCSFTNITSCPQVLLFFLNEKNISINIFISIQYLRNFSFIFLLTSMSLWLLNHINLLGVLHN